MEKKKGNLVEAHALLALLAILLVITNSCVAATLSKTNSSYHCNGALGGCLIADDFDLEFIMDSHFSRILVGDGSPDPVTSGGGNPNVVPCDAGRGNSYDSCNGHKHPAGKCGSYRRPPCSQQQKV